MEGKSEIYTPKIVAESLGITPDLLKVWSNEFNVQIERSQGGHRRYSKENIEELKSIKEKIHIQKWTYDQVRAWRNGELDLFVAKEEKAELEKKMDQVLENQVLQQQFNQALIQKLHELTHELVVTKEHFMIASEKLIEVEKRNKDLEENIERKLEKRNQLVVESMREIQNQKSKRKGIFSLFRK
ncbi:mercury resistance protein (plasmid) [Bacillus cereus]|uniref:MerR family transcriptional regulator n=1 Tax=Bacillus cereus TaxID=1396 RepID=UPI000C2D250F|nr:MerR family transcriptional regulator [Bacillus cereus]AUB67084.1 mercury resistance protein [Bacillus cereus]